MTVGISQLSRPVGGESPATEDALIDASPHRELSVVSLVRDIEADGKTVLAGARGAVVAAYADGEGYEVEWFKPAHGSVTVEKALSG